MTLSADEAAAALADIETVRLTTRRSVAYRLASANLILWGAIVAAANLLAWVFPLRGGRIWLGLTALGVVGSLLLGRRMARHGFGPVWRLFAGFALFFGFGAFWSITVGHFDGRQLNAFWPTFVMFGYALAGLWIGRAYVALGVGLAALIALGYLYIGPLFQPYLALVNGGGLMLCGLWMRRA